MQNFYKGWARMKESLRKKLAGDSDHHVSQFRPDKPWLDLQHHTNGQIKRPSELEYEMNEPPSSVDEELLDRIQGSLIGMAVGDALGAHVEFRPHQYLLEHPVQDLVGGGTWGLEKGQFTDDTSMALCLATSLVSRRDFVPYDQLVRYKWWLEQGYMSSTGHCFDIGRATNDSLEEFRRRQSKFAKRHHLPMESVDYLAERRLLEIFKVNCSKKNAAGNGALMRLAPVPLFFHSHVQEAIDCSGYSGYITHGDEKAYDACRYFGALIFACLHNYRKDELLADDFHQRHRPWFGGKPLCPAIQRIAEGSYKREGGYRDGIRGGGYIVEALEAALWAFWSDRDSFERGALAAVNLGDDTDTTAAIYGQLAGAYYGYKRLPKRWTDYVYAKEFILNLSKWIAYEGQEWNENGNIWSVQTPSFVKNAAESLENIFSSSPQPKRQKERSLAPPRTLPTRRKPRSRKMSAEIYTSPAAASVQDHQGNGLNRTKQKSLDCLAVKRPITPPQRKLF